MHRVRNSASVVEVGVARRGVVGLRCKHIDLKAAADSRSLTEEAVVEGPDDMSSCVEIIEFLRIKLKLTPYPYCCGGGPPYP